MTELFTSTDFTYELEFVEFLDQVQYQADGCWLWCGNFERGHPMTYREHGKMAADRFILYHSGQPPPEKRGYRVIQVCAHVTCVNPAHLRWIPIANE